MDIELKQFPKLHQQMVITPQLQQAIKLLQLSRLELVEKLRQEVEENPVLEELPEDEDKTADEPLSAGEAALWESFDEGPEAYTPRDRSSRPSFENFLSKRDSLSDYLMWQLRLSAVKGEEENIGALIIGNIDEDGYLRTDLEEIAKMALS